VAVADDWDVVVGVEETVPVRVEEPDSLGADDVHRLGVGEACERRAERRFSALG
jgi:hypothetical protein